MLHYLVPMRRPGGRAAVLSAKAKDFRGGRHGERGEIASSDSGGRVKDEHSPLRSVYRKKFIVKRTVLCLRLPSKPWKDDSVERSPTILAHSTAQKSPGGISEAI